MATLQIEHVLRGYPNKDIMCMAHFYGVDTAQQKTDIIRGISGEITKSTRMSANMPPFDYSKTLEITSFDVEDHKIPNLHSLMIKQRGGVRMFDDYQKQLISGEKIIYYSVGDEIFQNTILVSNYGRIFNSGGMPKIKNFEFWISPENIKVLQNMSETLTSKKYSIHLFDSMVHVLAEIKEAQTTKQAHDLATALHAIEDLKAGLATALKEIEKLKAGQSKASPPKKSLIPRITTPPKSNKPYAYSSNY